MRDSDSNPNPRCIHTSIAVFAWNEEETITSLLRSLFAQSLLPELIHRGLGCEVICVLNGCTDRTAARAVEFFSGNELARSARVPCEVLNLDQRGKLNAWNQYVHCASAKEARFLFMMDADILIRQPETLWNMVSLLERDPQASIAVDRPRKHLEFKARPSVREGLSVRASQLTHSAPAQVCAQLYCIRAETARNIWMPKDLPACEDGFIKTLVCTDFLSGPPDSTRIRLAQNAEHTFEAYTSLSSIIKNQKRQIIGQTVIHVAVDQYLKNLPASDRQRMGQTLRNLEANDPGWLQRRVARHLAKTKLFWRICPGYVSLSLERWARMRGKKKIANLPAALARTCLSTVASFLAYRSLKRGAIDYWPKAQRTAGELKSPTEPLPLDAPAMARGN